MQVSDDQIDAVAPRWHDLVLQSDTNRRDAKMIDEKDWKKTALQELQSATDGRRISATAT